MGYIKSILAVLLLLTGCRYNEPPSEEIIIEETRLSQVVNADLTGEIEFVNWLTDNPGMGQLIVDRFNEAYPNIQVTLTTLPFNEMREYILARNSTGIPVDVYQLNMPWAQELVSQQVIEPLDQHMLADENFRKDDLVQEPMQAIDGHTYMVPLTMMHFVLYCNTDHFEAADIPLPTTWEELETAARLLTDRDQDRYGLSLSMSSSGAENGPALALYPLLYSAGGRTIKEGQPNLESPEALAMMTFVDGLYESGLIRPGSLTKEGTHVIDDFAGGLASMMIQPSTHITTVRNRNSDINFQVVGVPGPESVTEKATRLHGFELGIGASSENKDLAWTFISWMTSPENNGWIGELLGQMPANERADTSYLQKDKVMQAAYAMMRHMTYVEELMVTPQTTDTWRIFTDYTQQMFLDELSPEEAVEGIQEEWEVLFLE